LTCVGREVGFYLGLLLVPLAVVSAGAGALLATQNKK